MRPRANAFTLIELLIVIAMIGILVSLVAVAVAKVRAIRLKTSQVAELAQLDFACRQFRFDMGCHPPDLYSPDAGRLVRTNPPTFCVGMLLDVLPYHAAFKTYTEGVRGAGSPQLYQGVTSKCLVFFLSTRFTIEGKTHGPYFNFDASQLQPTGETYPGSGTASVNGRQVRWWAQGIQVVNGRVAPTEERVSFHPNVPVYKHLDKYGVYKTQDPNNRNYTVYDSYTPGGAWVNYVMHNVGEFDLFSYGLDGLSALDNVPGTKNQAAIDELKKDGVNLNYYIGSIHDDINDWGQAYVGRGVKPKSTP